MKVAVTANFDKEIKATTTGGSELFTYLLAKYLSRLPRVSQVHVIGVGKDHIRLPKVRFHSVLPVSSREFVKRDKVLRELNSERADFFSQIEGALGIKTFQILKDIPFDVLQNNSTSYSLNALLGTIGKPVVTTLHTNLGSPSIVIPKSLGLFGSKQRLLPIAEHQRSKARRLGIPTDPVIHNGVETSVRPDFSTLPSAYALWIGRVSRKHDKGLREAVIAAKRAKVRLKVIASIDDRKFYEEKIRPELSSWVTLLPKIKNVREKNDLYRNAAFLLYPIQWEEPFGLIFLEAMRVGTPVIAFAKGAVPEIIKDGSTGFVVNPSRGTQGIVQAIGRLRRMDPAQYRAMRIAAQGRVRDRFTVERMTQDYFDYYRKILKAK